LNTRYIGEAATLSVTDGIVNDATVKGLSGSRSHTDTATLQNNYTKAQSYLRTAMSEHMDSINNTAGHDDRKQYVEKIDKVLKGEIINILENATKSGVGADIYAAIEGQLGLTAGGVGNAIKVLEVLSKNEHSTETTPAGETDKIKTITKPGFDLGAAIKAGGKLSANWEESDTKKLQNKLSETAQKLTSDMSSTTSNIGVLVSKIDSEKTSEARNDANTAQQNWAFAQAEQTAFSENAIKAYSQKLLNQGYSEDLVVEQLGWLNSVGKEAAMADIMQVLEKDDFTQLVEKEAGRGVAGVKIGGIAAAAGAITEQIYNEMGEIQKKIGAGDPLIPGKGTVKSAHERGIGEKVADLTGLDRFRHGLFTPVPIHYNPRLRTNIKPDPDPSAGSTIRRVQY
jgi:hypothetical protein